MSSSRRLPGQNTVQSFADIDVPDQLRISLDTGWQHANALFTGSGIRPSTVGLITGLPGSGKTTVCLQLANYLINAGHTVFYNSCEESGEQIKMTLERLELKAMLSAENRDRAIHSNLPEIGDIIEASDKLRANVAPGKGFFLFIDSLQTIEKAHEGKGRPSGQQNQAVEAMWDLAEWCKKTYAVAQIIGQVTKDGTFSGRQEVKHCIDTHLHMSIDTERKSETYGQRIAEMQKNRFGLANNYFSYEMTSRGIIFND